MDRNNARNSGRILVGFLLWGIGFLCLILAGAAHAQTPSAPASAPLLDGTESELFDAIVDTDLDRINRDKLKNGGDTILRPLFGFQDIVMKTGTSTIVDVHNLGYGPCPETPQDYPIRLSQLGVVTGMVRDGGSQGCRLQAGDKSGNTQLLWYENVSGQKGKVVFGKLLKVYRVTVASEDLVQLLQEIRALIGGVEGIELRIVGTQVVVDGQVLVPRDLRRVFAVVERFQKANKPVLNLVEVSPISLKLLAKKMEEAIAGGKDRPKDITVRVVNGRFFLEGLVDKNVDRAVAEKICQSYVMEKYSIPSANIKEPVYDPKVLGDCVQMVRLRQGQPAEPDPVIAFRVDFVSVSRSFFKYFDFNWAPGLRADAGASWNSDVGQIVGNFTATLSGLFPKLNTAQNTGNARILKTANIIIRDGVNAKSGDPPKGLINEIIKIPYQNVSRNDDGSESTSTEFVEVKTEIEIQGKSVPGSEKLNIDISALQTEVRGGGQTSGAPPTISNTVKTSLVVSNGESAALGGLVTERRRISKDQGDVASNVSFKLFELDRTHAFTDSKEQFIVFVTPEKLRSPTEGTEQLKRKFRLRK